MRAVCVQRIAKELSSKGYGKVFIVKGGFLSWMDAQIKTKVRAAGPAMKARMWGGTLIRLALRAGSGKLGGCQFAGSWEYLHFMGSRGQMVWAAESKDG